MPNNYGTLDGQEDGSSDQTDHGNNFCEKICCGIACCLIGFGAVYVLSSLLPLDSGDENLLLLAEKIAEKMSNNITDNITEKFNTTFSH
jgi:hypothetical protein